MPYKTQNPHLGYSGKVETFNVLVSDGWPNSRIQLGYVFEKGTKRWQAVQIVDAPTVAAGDVLYWKNYLTYQATMTIGNSTRNEVAGIAEGVYLQDSYAWLRQGGLMAVKANAAPTVAFARGAHAVSDTSTNRVDNVNDVTATAHVKAIGICRAAIATAAEGVAAAAGFVVVDLDISPI